MTVRMPAWRARAMAGLTSGRAGSIMPEQADEDQVALGIGRRRLGGQLWQRPEGHAQDAQGVAGEPFVLFQDVLAPLVGQGADLAVFDDVGAQAEDDVGRALDEGHVARPAGADRGGWSSSACGRSRRGFRRRAGSRWLELLPPVAGLGRSDDQGALGRIARDAPALDAVFDDLFQASVVAQQSGPEEQRPAVQAWTGEPARHRHRRTRLPACSPRR